MTNEEFERAMAFLLESQASLSAKVDANTEAIARLTEISDRHEAEHEVFRREMRDMRSEMRDMRSEMRDMNVEVRDMKVEVRDAINTMLGVAESLAENVKSLTAITLDTRRRVESLEEGRS